MRAIFQPSAEPEEGSLDFEDDLQRFLRRYAGTSVYLERVWGNHGDHLIVMGAEALLSRAGVNVVDRPDRADVIVARGGGYAEAGAGHVLDLFEAYPSVPAVLLPTTLRLPRGYLSRRRPMARRAPTALWAREPTTYALLKDWASVREGVDAYLGHDTAFGLAKTEWLKRLATSCEARHLLVVERGDEETVTGLRMSGVGPLWIKELLPTALREGLKRIHRKIVAHRAAHTVFASSASEYLRRSYPDVSHLPLLAADISDGALMQFDDFVTTIAAAGAICTTRLHVGVLGALLGKPTVLHGGSFAGAYRKIEDVYEHSLRGFPNVVLLSGGSSLL